MIPTIPGPSELRERVERDIDRAIRRGRNGLRYAAGMGRPKVGPTPKDVIWKRDKAEVWHYRGGKPTHRPPVLIVHSLVSRSYVYDLLEGNSMIRFFMDSGLDILLTDWGVADEADAENTLETYVDDYLPRAVAAACDATGSDEITVLGYCFGGVLSLLCAARHPELPIRNLAIMATPIDFSKLSGLVSLVRDGKVDIEDLLDETGNVPPEAMERSVRVMKPTADLAQYANLWQNLWNDKFFAAYQAMNQWVGDHVPFPGAAAKQAAEQLIQNNGLMEGTMRLGGHAVDLGAITCPTLSVLAKRDHIVPPECTTPLPGLLTGTKADELRLDAGHVGLAMGRSAKKVTLPHIAQWIKDHSDPIGGSEA
jgi:polyhydroxyalkanoate synthase subunit PhaC